MKNELNKARSCHTLGITQCPFEQAAPNASAREVLKLRVTEGKKFSILFLTFRCKKKTQPRQLFLRFVVRHG